MMIQQGVQAQQLFRAEFAPFEARKDAESGVRHDSEYFRTFNPVPASVEQGGITMSEEFVLPPKWSDRVVVLHLESVGMAYDLKVNGHLLGEVEDTLTPAEFDITKHLTDSLNCVDVVMRGSRAEVLESGVERRVLREKFEGSYFVAQPTTHISDFTVELVPDSTRKFGVLNIAVEVTNSFTATEAIEVGYDIYDPVGTLHEFSTTKIDVASGAVDTIRFNPYIYKTYTGSNEWTTKSPKLYSVMLYTKRGGVILDYIPLKVGFGETLYKDGVVTRFDKAISLSSVRYNAALTKAQSRTEIAALKAKGYNTLRPEYSQPLWFYELCNELGVWVIESVNINANHEPANRKVGGTPSNDPRYLKEYIRRAKQSYYRTRNFECVVAYALGGDESGNGYNMYKLYEWMKSVEQRRPIIYPAARDEWNSDPLKTK